MMKKKLVFVILFDYLHYKFILSKHCVIHLFAQPLGSTVILHPVEVMASSYLHAFLPCYQTLSHMKCSVHWGFQNIYIRTLWKTEGVYEQQLFQTGSMGKW